MTAPSDRGARVPRGVVAGLLVLFLVTRVLVHGGVSAFFAYDTYKYLAGADSLSQWGVLGPVFDSLLRTGAVLHAVPGYAWLLEGIWSVLGHVTLDAATFFQAGVSLAAFAMAGHLAARHLGAVAGAAVFAVLSLSPSLAWLERTVMPDSLAPCLVIAGCWLADTTARAAGPTLAGRAGALVAGVLAGAGVLLRTSSWTFVPLPLLVALASARSRRAVLAWSALYLVGVAAPLAPWMLHNGEAHGVYRVSASTGRNLLFSGLWGRSQADVRRSLARQVQLPAGVPPSPYNLCDHVFAGLVRRLGSIADADAEMGRIALSLGRELGPGRIAVQRAELFGDLFTAEPLPALVRDGPRGRPPPDLMNAWDWEARSDWAERRFQHVYSADVANAVRASRRSSAPAGSFFAWWFASLRLDGTLLLVLFAAGVPALLLSGPGRWTLLATFAGPPLAFLSAYSLVGAPLYRYQAGLHPFMLAAVVCAVVILGGRLLGRPSGSPESEVKSAAG